MENLEVYVYKKSPNKVSVVDTVVYLPDVLYLLGSRPCIFSAYHLYFSYCRERMKPPIQ